MMDYSITDNRFNVVIVENKAMIWSWNYARCMDTIIVIPLDNLNAKTIIYCCSILLYLYTMPRHHNIIFSKHTPVIMMYTYLHCNKHIGVQYIPCAS